MSVWGLTVSVGSTEVMPLWLALLGYGAKQTTANVMPKDSSPAAMVLTFSAFTYSLALL